MSENQQRIDPLTIAVVKDEEINIRKEVVDVAVLGGPPLDAGDAFALGITDKPIASLTRSDVIAIAQLESHLSEEKTMLQEGKDLRQIDKKHHKEDQKIGEDFAFVAASEVMQGSSSQSRGNDTKINTGIGGALISEVQSRLPAAAMAAVAGMNQIMAAAASLVSGTQSPSDAALCTFQPASGQGNVAVQQTGVSHT